MLRFVLGEAAFSRGRAGLTRLSCERERQEIHPALRPLTAASCPEPSA